MKVNIKRASVSTILQCTVCGEKVVIYRLVGRQKKVGHLKKLYCYRCKKEVNHVELKDGLKDGLSLYR